MNRRPLSKRLRCNWLAGTSVFAVGATSALALANLTPEQEALKLSKILKPIPDEQWAEIAGTHATESYSIVNGDNLFDISKRLFGDGKYWPKVWALNNGTILNPHMILPGNSVQFSPGSAESLPQVAIAENGAAPAADGSDAVPTATDAGDVSAIIPARKKRSQQWRRLPPQGWENVPVKAPPTVDAHGFDRRSKLNFARPTAIDLPAIAASEKLPILGQVVGSRAESSHMRLGDSVYIRADEELQVGETYAVTQAPAVLKSRKSDRVGYSYLILGKVQILGVRDNLFIGNVVAGRDLIFRGASLIKLPGKAKHQDPIPGPSSLEGVLMMDHNLSTYTTAQFKTAFVDRGADDGVQPGMVFRAYQYYDPSNDKKVTSSNFIIDADLIVLQTSARFSYVLVLNSLSMITENATVILLTDVSDLMHNKGFREKLGPQDLKDRELDELDKLDPGGGLGKEEERELRQLERWKGNGPVPPAAGSETLPPPPGPEGEILPPPPGSGAEVLPPPPETTPPPPDAALPPPPPAQASDAILDLAPPTDSTPPPPPPTAGGEELSLPPPPDALPPPPDAALPPPPPSGAVLLPPPPAPTPTLKK